VRDITGVFRTKEHYKKEWRVSRARIYVKLDICVRLHTCHTCAKEPSKNWGVSTQKKVRDFRVKLLEMYVSNYFCVKHG